MTSGGTLARSYGTCGQGGGFRLMIASRSSSVSIPTNGAVLLNQ